MTSDDNPITPEKVGRGRLFFETRASIAGTVSRLNDEQVGSLTGTLPEGFAEVPVPPASAFAGRSGRLPVGAGAPESPTAAPPGPGRRKPQ